MGRFVIALTGTASAAWAAFALYISTKTGFGGRCGGRRRRGSFVGGANNFTFRECRRLGTS